MTAETARRVTMSPLAAHQSLQRRAPSVNAQVKPEIRADEVDKFPQKIDLNTGIGVGIALVIEYLAQQENRG